LTIYHDFVALFIASENSSFSQVHDEIEAVLLESIVELGVILVGSPSDHQSPRLSSHPGVGVEVEVGHPPGKSSNLKISWLIDLEKII